MYGAAILVPQLGAPTWRPSHNYTKNLISKYFIHSISAIKSA